MMQFARKQLL